MLTLGVSIYCMVLEKSVQTTMTATKITVTHIVTRNPLFSVIRLSILPMDHDRSTTNEAF